MSQGMGIPRIPGARVNSPQGNQFKIQLDVMALPNAKCIKCGNAEFTLRANVKMISPMQSPDGQWAHGVAQWWACLQCGYKFDPSEWVNKRFEDSKKEEATNADKTIVLPDAGSADK
jgi:predicted nucleic-acid-binding Zn-ribbon protein